MPLKIRSSIKRSRDKNSYLRQECRINLDSINIIKYCTDNEICIEINNFDSICHTGDQPKVHFPLNPDQAFLLGNKLISMAVDLKRELNS